jgi:hypothetical protein
LKCPYCKAEVRSSARFCSSCGKKVKNRKKKIALIAVSVAVILVISLILVAGQMLKPTQNVASGSIAKVILSPNSQTVVLSSLGKQPAFSFSLIPNGPAVIYPCSITLYSSFPNVSGSSKTVPCCTISNYDGSSSSFGGRVPLPNQPETVTYFAVVADSNGDKVTSNSVTIEYK